jgi:hypothetical protein
MDVFIAFLPVLLSLLFSVVITGIYLSYHHRKYDAMMICLIGVIMCVVTRYFIEKKIGLEIGFGLFALFSLFNFRRTYHKNTMVYMVLTMSYGILASLILSTDIVWCVTVGVFFIA